MARIWLLALQRSTHKPQHQASNNYIRVETTPVIVQDTAANVEVGQVRVLTLLSSCSGAVVTMSVVIVLYIGEGSHRHVSSATPKQNIHCQLEVCVSTQ